MQLLPIGAQLCRREIQSSFQGGDGAEPPRPLHRSQGGRGAAVRLQGRQVSRTCNRCRFRGGARRRFYGRTDHRYRRGDRFRLHDEPLQQHLQDRHRLNRPAAQNPLRRDGGGVGGDGCSYSRYLLGGASEPYRPTGSATTNRTSPPIRSSMSISASTSPPCSPYGARTTRSSFRPAQRRSGATCPMPKFASSMESWLDVDPINAAWPVGFPHACEFDYFQPPPRAA